MMRTLWAGVTGLQVHQAKMDVIGNNIANVNTVGFKKSEVIFEDLMSQTMEIAHGPSDGLGGTNAMQVGLGVQTGSISQVHTQGQLQTTGKNTDLAISGNGFFVVAGGNADDLHYTRNGSFHLDSEGTLVAASGHKVQGWMSAPDPVSGDIVVNSSTSPIQDIQIKVGDTIPARETQNVIFSGNLNSNNGLAIEPLVVEFTQDNISRKIQMNFEHAHPTLNYYTYTATWYENPPNGFEVGDAVIDRNTGIQAQGILELDANGLVIGHYKNTDLASSVNAVLKENLYSLDSASTIDLNAVNADDNSSPSTGMFRLRFEDPADTQEYTLYYSADYDYNNPGNATWQSQGTGRTNQDSTFGDVNITVKASDWRGLAVVNDTLYFEVAAGNGNGILDLPSEIPKAEDDNPLLRASAPEANALNGGTAVLSGVNVNTTQAQTAPSLPDITGTPNYTFRNWRVRFVTPTTYSVEYANYTNPFDPTDAGNTWTRIGALTSATGTPTNNPGNAGTATLDAVTVGTAAVPGDAFVITFTGANTYNVSVNGGPPVAGNTGADLVVSGVTIPAGSWTNPNGGVIGDSVSFTIAGYATYDAANNVDNDFSDAIHGIQIPEENFTGTAQAGDLLHFRVSYATSPSYNRDFFTVSDIVTQFDNNIAAGGGNAGTAVLSAVDVDGTAPADTWTVTFNADGTFNIAGATTGAIGVNVSPAATFSALGLEIQSSYWTGTANAGDTFTFSTSANTVLTDIVVPSGNTQSESITFVPNTADTTMNQADAGNPVSTTVKNRDEYQYATSVNTYDSLGAAHTLTFYFERKSTNEWMWSVMDPTPKDPNDVKMAGYGILAFKEDGTYDSANSVTYNSEVGQDSPTRPSNLQTVIYDPSAWGGAPPTENGAGRVEINLDFADLVQYAAQNDGEVFSQDGSLNSFTINQLGYVTGLYDNGQTMDIARVALATFNNPSGLITEGGSLYRTSGNSGVAHIGVPGTAGRGSITGGSLEMSNVDLSEEFTNMIVTQRGFQANSRSITTADQMLQELLGLKR